MIPDSRTSPPRADLSRRVFLTRSGLAVAGLSLPALMAACGGSRAGSSAGASAAPTASGPQRVGGRLVFGVDTLTGNSDPGTFASFADWMAIDLVARGLTKANFATGEIEPDLATSWETARGGRRYVFTLREGVTFHDGETMTAHDFVRSWRRLFDPKDPTAAPGTFAALFLGAPNTKDNFKALDDQRFQVDLELPDVAFPAKCAVQAGVCLSSKAIEAKKKKIGQSLVGTGPFKFSAATADQSASFDRFDDYIDGPVYLDSVVLQVIPEPTALVGSLDSGAVQASVFVPPANLGAVKKTISVYEPKAYSVQLAFLNVGSPVLSDLRVRKAVNFAIDRKAIMSSGFGGRATQAGYVVPKPTLGYDDSLQVYSTQDLAQAKQLIKDAGAAGKVVRVVSTNNRWWPTVGQVIEANLRAIGLVPRMQYLDGSAFGAKESDPKGHDIALDTYAAIMPDPDDAAYTLFKSDQSFAQAITQSFLLKDVSAKIDRLVEQGRAEQDKARRKQIYVDLQKLAAEELMAHSVLCYAPAPVVTNSKVQGLDLDSLGTYRLKAEGISLAS